VSRIALLAAVLAGASFAGCAGEHPNYEGIASELRPCTSPLRACVKWARGLDDDRVVDLRKNFPSAIIVKPPKVPTADDCDIVFQYTAFFNDNADVYSAYTGEFLARFETPGYKYTADYACQAFLDESGGLFLKIPAASVLARRAPARPSAAAPSPEPAAAASPWWEKK
jgi:hypothetical protein